jgi:hypothetical protein
MVIIGRNGGGKPSQFGIAAIRGTHDSFVCGWATRQENREAVSLCLRADLPPSTDGGWAVGRTDLQHERFDYK